MVRTTFCPVAQIVTSQKGNSNPTTYRRSISGSQKIVSDRKEGEMATVTIGMSAQRKTKGIDPDGDFRTLVDNYVEALILVHYNNRPTGCNSVAFMKRLEVISRIQALYPDYQGRVLGCLGDEVRSTIKGSDFMSALEFLLTEIHKSRLN